MTNIVESAYLINDTTASDILAWTSTENTGVNWSDDTLIRGVYVETEVDLIKLPTLAPTSVGAEGVYFVGVNIETGEKVVAKYAGATLGIGVSFTSLGPTSFQSGVGVFGFDGESASMGGVGCWILT